MASLKHSTLLSAGLLLFTMAGCTEPLEITPPGTYDATTYYAGPVGGDRIDILALGVHWTLIIDENRTAISKWDVVSGKQASHISYNGIAHREGSTVTFMNFSGPDPILTERTWTIDGDQLISLNQTVNGTNAVVRFTRREP